MSDDKSSGARSGAAGMPSGRGSRGRRGQGGTGGLARDGQGGAARSGSGSRPRSESGSKPRKPGGSFRGSASRNGAARSGRPGFPKRSGSESERAGRSERRTRDDGSARRNSHAPGRDDGSSRRSERRSGFGKRGRDGERQGERRAPFRSGSKDGSFDRAGKREERAAGKAGFPRKGRRPRRDDDNVRGRTGAAQGRGSGKRADGRFKGAGDNRRGSAAPRRKGDPRRSKREFDALKVRNLMGTEGGIYRGELDPLRGEREQIAPGHHTRAMREDAEFLKSREPHPEALPDVPDDVEAPEKFHPCKASAARLAALDVTRMVRTRKAFAQNLIESRIENSSLQKADRAFATLLVLGVVSTRGTLDEMINKALRKPADAFADVRDALRISTYEILFLGKAPHAAIDQGVELVRAVSPSAAGLGNAILHRVYALKDEFPFGDPNHDLDALARVYAFPTWMARQLVKDMGAKAASTFMRVSNDPAPLYIAVNTIRASVEEVAAAFADAGATLDSVSFDDEPVSACFKVSNPRVIGNASIRALFDAGKILVADASAQAVAHFALPSARPASMLEVGCGRGTKTILMQAEAQRRFGAQVPLVALDLHDFKVEQLKTRASAYGVEVLEAVAGNAARMARIMPDRTFDAVLVDAPCSGLGTLRRHQEIRWNIKRAHIQELADENLALLKSVSGAVAGGGQLVYSTCTVTYAENNGVVKAFLESPEGSAFSLAPLAGKPCFSPPLAADGPDAHFACRFVRTA